MVFVSERVLLYQGEESHQAPQYVLRLQVATLFYAGTRACNFDKEVNVMLFYLFIFLIFVYLLADISPKVSVEEKQLQKGETWSVHKFGGTCVGSSQRIKNVADIIINDDSEKKLVVVSAMSKVTDMMYDLIYKAQSRDESYVSALDAVLEKHSSTAHELLDGDGLASFLSLLCQDISNLKAMLRAIYIGYTHIKSLSPLLILRPFFWC